MKLDSHQLNKIHQSLKEVQSFIQKETNKGPRNRPADIQKLLDKYIEMEKNLIKMLKPNYDWNPWIN